MYLSHAAVGAFFQQTFVKKKKEKEKSNVFLDFWYSKRKMFMKSELMNMWGKSILESYNVGYVKLKINVIH